MFVVDLNLLHIYSFLTQISLLLLLLLYFLFKLTKNFIIVILLIIYNIKFVLHVPFKIKNKHTYNIYIFINQKIYKKTKKNNINLLLMQKQNHYQKEALSYVKGPILLINHLILNLLMYRSFRRLILIRVQFRFCLLLYFRLISILNCMSLFLLVMLFLFISLLCVKVIFCYLYNIILNHLLLLIFV